MNALSHTRSQSIPSDVTKPDNDTFRETVTIHHETNAIHEDDADTIDEAHLLLSSILDHTTLMAGFDKSCFDGLDDLVIHDPFEAFAEICWQDAVGHNGSSSSTIRVTTPTQLLNKPTGRRKLPSLTGVTRISKERDGDVAKDRTYTSYDEEPVSPSDVKIDVTSCASLHPEQNLRWSVSKIHLITHLMPILRKYSILPLTLNINVNFVFRDETHYFLRFPTMMKPPHLSSSKLLCLPPIVMTLLVTIRSLRVAHVKKLCLIVSPHFAQTCRLLSVP